MELYNAPHGIHAPITVKLFSQDFEFTYLIELTIYAQILCKK